MLNSGEKWVLVYWVLLSILSSTSANDNELKSIVSSVTDRNEKSKTSSEEVVVETEEDNGEPPSSYSQPINNGDPSSGIKIITAPDLSKAKHEKPDKLLENFPNFDKFILDNDAWPENFLSKKNEETVADTSKLTPQQIAANTLYSVSKKLIQSHSGKRGEGYRLLFKAAEADSVEAKVTLAWAKLLGNAWVEQDIPAANFTFHNLAEQGNAAAQMALGFLYSAGIGVNVSQAKSVVYYTFGAIGGDTYAQIALGYRYYAGISVTTSCDKALDFYKDAAAKVASEVSLSGGQMVHRIRLMEEADSTGYNAGILDKDLFEYYQLLANKGDITAQVGLGQLHFQGGRGIPLDYEKAHHYFLQAAEANSPIALGFLGRMYLEGNEFIKQDNKTAFNYFKKSADQNNPVGQSGLGLMYLRGQGVEQDYAEAFKYFQLASEQGWVDGQLQLGIMYYSGLGVRRDYKAAIKYFNLASQSGHVLAFYNLAQMHATGTGLMRSCSTAVDLYKNVVERGRWGEILMEGYNQYRDGHMTEAYLAYALLSELGYDVAQSNAAYMLDKGDVALWEHDTERYMRALMYWGRSAAQGYSPAQVKLGDYYYYGLGTPIDYEIAAMHYRLASETQHNAQAFFNLGYMHEQGLGMTQDMHLAKRCYDMAAETSVDAKVPVALALIKLSVVFGLKYFEETRWNEWFLLLNMQQVMGNFWDIYLLVVLCCALAVMIYFKMRRNSPSSARPHQD